jgi:pimeloyl-ACP methyl ester carboxylesterase
LKEIAYAIRFLESNYRYNKLILVGHSTGAIDAALYACQDHRIDQLILLGGVGNLKEAVSYDFSEAQVNDFLKQGYILYYAEDYWIHNKKLSKAFYDEFFTLDVLGELYKYNGPVLIIHGEKDEAVPFSKDPIELKNAAKNAQLVIIHDADHQFLEPAHWEEVISTMDEFIKRSSSLSK